MLRQNKVDGAIVATHYLQTSDYKDLSLPLVAMDVFLDESIPSVHSNHIRGGKLAARPFIDGNAHCVLQLSLIHISGCFEEILICSLGLDTSYFSNEFNIISVTSL